ALAVTSAAGKPVIQKGAPIQINVDGINVGLNFEVSVAEPQLNIIQETGTSFLDFDPTAYIKAYQGLRSADKKAAKKRLIEAWDFFSVRGYGLKTELQKSSESSPEYEKLKQDHRKVEDAIDTIMTFYLESEHLNPDIPFDSQGQRCPLTEAVFTGNIHRVSRLLDHGANPNGLPTMSPEFRPISICKDPEILKLLIKKGASLFRVGDIALEYAALNNAPEIIEILVNAGVNTNNEYTIAPGVMTTIVGIAAEAGSTAAIIKLIDLGCPADGRTDFYPPLSMAIKAGQVDAIKALLSKGANLVSTEHSNISKIEFDSSINETTRQEIKDILTAYVAKSAANTESKESKGTLVAILSALGAIVGGGAFMNIRKWREQERQNARKLAEAQSKIVTSNAKALTAIQVYFTGRPDELSAENYTIQFQEGKTGGQLVLRYEIPSIEFFRPRWQQLHPQFNYLLTELSDETRFLICQQDLQNSGFQIDREESKLVMSRQFEGVIQPLHRVEKPGRHLRTVLDQRPDGVALIEQVREATAKIEAEARLQREKNEAISAIYSELVHRIDQLNTAKTRVTSELRARAVQCENGHVPDENFSRQIQENFQIAATTLDRLVLGAPAHRREALKLEAKNLAANQAKFQDALRNELLLINKITALFETYLDQLNTQADELTTNPASPQRLFKTLNEAAIARDELAPTIKIYQEKLDQAKRLIEEFDSKFSELSRALKEVKTKLRSLAATTRLTHDVAGKSGGTVMTAASGTHLNINDIDREIRNMCIALLGGGISPEEDLLFTRRIGAPWAAIARTLVKREPLVQFPVMIDNGLIPADPPVQRQIIPRIYSHGIDKSLHGEDKSVFGYFKPAIANLVAGLKLLINKQSKIAPLIPLLSFEDPEKSKWLNDILLEIAIKSAPESGSSHYHLSIPFLVRTQEYTQIKHGELWSSLSRLATLSFIYDCFICTPPNLTPWTRYMPGSEFGGGGSAGAGEGANSGVDVYPSRPTSPFPDSSPIADAEAGD
ncbi:hypothetical protein EBR96_04695, partial [bacterium]|nr:hypothetical protein [bacterium]